MTNSLKKHSTTQAFCSNEPTLLVRNWAVKTMEVTTILKPVYPTPHLLAGEKVPLFVFNRAAFYIFVLTMRAYSVPAPSNRGGQSGPPHSRRSVPSPGWPASRKR
jgi:hypothetical protein